MYLHRDDFPETLALLDRLLGDHEAPPDGYRRDESGADVDWDLLAESYLSTSEKAVLQIARGCAVLERHGGGLAPELRWQVRATVKSVTE